MSTPLDIERRANITLKNLNLWIIIIPIATLIGWGIDSRLLTAIHPDFPVMQPATAVGLFFGILSINILIRSSLGIKLHRILAVLAGNMILIGSLTILEHIFNWNLKYNFEQFLGPNNAKSLGWPSPQAAICLLLLGVALVLNKKNLNTNYLGQMILMFTIFNSIVAINGYIFDSNNLYGFPIEKAGMAIHTSIAVLLMSLSILYFYRDYGFMKYVYTDSLVGWMTRRLLGFSLVIIPIYGIVTKMGVVFKWYDQKFQIFIFSVFLVLTLAFFSWKLIMIFHREDIRKNTLLAEMRKTKEQFEVLFDGASDGIFIADLNGVYMDVNVAGYEMLGYSKEEVIGKKIDDILDEKDLPKLAETKNGLLNNRSILIQEWDIKKKNGEFITVQVSSRILPDNRWIGIVRDFTERKKIETKLKNSESKFRGLLNSSFEAILTIDREGIINFVNKKGADIFGYQEEEILGKAAKMLFPKPIIKKYKQAWKHYIESPTPLSVGQMLDLYARKKDGTVFPIDLSLSPTITDEGIIITAVIRNVSDVRKRQTQMKALADIGKIMAKSSNIEESLLLTAKAIVPSLADGCVIRLKNDEDKMAVVAIEHKNHQKKHVIFQLQREEYLINNEQVWGDKFKQDLKTIVVNDKTSEALSFWKQLGIGSYAMIPIFVKTRLFGILTIIKNEGSEAIQEHDVTYFESIALRIALAIDNEKLIREAQNEVKNRAKIMSIVSHDLKSSITAIELATGALKKGSENNEKTKSTLLDVVGKASEQMRELISNLLDFDKIHQGRFSIIAKQEDLLGLINELLPGLEIQAAAKEIKLVACLPESLPKFKLDANRITQVLQNLIGNAIKFTPKYGEISISVVEESDSVIIEIRDNGIGIDSNELPRVFDYQWQASETSHLGSGLGLSIVKAIVEAHNGSISVASKKGEGTTFFVKLPMLFS